MDRFMALFIFLACIFGSVEGAAADGGDVFAGIIGVGIGLTFLFALVGWHARRTA